MKTILLMQCGRTTPGKFKTYYESLGYKLECLDPVAESWEEHLPTAYAIMLLLPAWGGRLFLAPEQLWYQFLLNNYPHLRLCFASYQECDHSNHLDLLKLGDYTEDFWQALPKIVKMNDIPNFEGIDLNDKLNRFFAGHGQDSVVAVLTRIRLVVQMASREVLRMDTPYDEIYEELVEPAQLSLKWTEWRNRWVYYKPLFRYTPFAHKMERIAKASATLEDWMASDGSSSKPLESGRILKTLNEVRTELKAIEEEYVIQKLSHTYS